MVYDTRLRDYTLLALVPVVVIGWYGGMAAKAGYGIARALWRGEVGDRRITSESQRIERKEN